MSEQFLTSYIEVYHHVFGRTLRIEPLGAIMLFLQGKVTISRHPQIVCDDEEKTYTYQAIIDGIYALRDDTPSGQFREQIPKLEALEEKVLNFVKEYFAKDPMASTYQADIVKAFEEANPAEHYQDDTIARRLRELRKKGHLESSKLGHYELRRYS